MLRNLFCVLFVFRLLPAFAQVKKAAPEKLSPSLQKLLQTTKSSDSIDVSLSVTKHFSSPASLRILATPSPGFLYLVRLPLTALPLLTQNEQVIFINRIYSAREEVNTGASDPTLNTITYTQRRFPSVRGGSVVSLVKERFFDTTDIDLQGRIRKTGIEDNNVTSHASLMATIMAGAANSSPFALGAAPAAILASSSFRNLFPDPDSVIQQQGISVQNHSYGTVVESFYGNEAVAFDQQSVRNPLLVSVFSAGNTGTSSPAEGPYAGLPNMANLTGNFKQAKNVITVSGVDSTGRLLPSSSRGPAFDGRIKPELVAYGEDGSSGAAALVSGAAILVQDAFRQKRGRLPSAALTKAVLLNSATNLGEKGVDYLSGYGNLNAFRAVNNVIEERVMEDSVTQSEVKTFFISVPALTKQLKLTLAWNDPAAEPNAAKALVNDLDVVVTDSHGQTWLPWVLDPTPSQNLLLQSAQRKTDTLNNAEQITIEDPAEGNYTVEIKGSKLASVRQAFALAYQLDTANSFYWIYPTASDHLAARQRHLLRWQSNMIGKGRIEFATAGNHWQEVATIDSVGRNYLYWITPDTTTQARLRFITDTQTIESETFTINPQPGLQTGFHCEDSFLLYWPRLNADSFRLYRLDTKYLEPILQTADTAVILAKAQHSSRYYSIAPVIKGKEGLRSNTINYQNQAVGCYLRSFYLQSQSGGTAVFIAQLGTTYNVAAVSLEKWTGTAFTPVQTIQQPAVASFEFSNVAVHPGENRFRFVILLANGTILYSATETAYVVGDTVPVFVYPNPAKQGDMLKVLVNEVGRYTMLLYDAMGKQVFQKELNESVTMLPVNWWAKGLYFIKVLDRDGKTYLQKQLIY